MAYRFVVKRYTLKYTTLFLFFLLTSCHNSHTTEKSQVQQDPGGQIATDRHKSFVEAAGNTEDYIYTCENTQTATAPLSADSKTVLPFHKETYLESEILENIEIASCRPFVSFMPTDSAIVEFPALSQQVLSQQFIENTLPQILQNGGPRCYGELLSFYAPNNLIPPWCIQNQKKKSCVKYLSSAQKLYEALDKALESAEQNPRQFSYLKAYTLFLENKNPYIEPNDIRDIRYHKDEHCEFPIGKSKVISSKYGTAVTWGAVSEKEFRLTRLTSEKYVFELNVRFKPSCEIPKDLSAELSDRWLRRANRCFEVYKPYLLGPNSEALEIRFIKEPVAFAPRAHEIEIKGQPRGGKDANDQDDRGHAGQYFPDFDCVTILHEALHLTGLVDEYREHFHDYKCRLLGPEDSIMGNHSFAEMRTVNTGLSLLRAAHVRFLLNPNCKEKNSIYYKCASYAYEGGNHCNYKDLPSECSAGAVSWINE